MMNIGNEHGHNGGFCFLMALALGGLMGSAVRAGTVPAFPEAEGFGSTTPGGRDGRVIKVTSLQDSGPGSLREACQARGPRIIVFDVGGYIELASDIEIAAPFCTIAGQSAPGDGVCVRGGGLTISTHDVVVRYLRVRLGFLDPKKIDRFRDCIHISGQTPPSRIVIDHCSLTWTRSRNLVTWSGAHDITVQWCILAQPLFRLEGNSRAYSGMGFLIGDDSKNITVHHCLLAHQFQRNPRLKNGVHADIVNNVIYNWSSTGALGIGDYQGGPATAPVQANVVNNWFQAGLNTQPQTPVIHAATAAQLYVAGNITNQGLYAADLTRATRNVTSVPERWPAAPVAMQAAERAYQLVLERAGATVPRRDQADERIVETVRSASGRFVASEEEAGGWPDLRRSSARPDRDGDGMPDAWERAAGLDPNDASDAGKDPDHDGYSHIEDWLNSLIPSRAEPPSSTGPATGSTAPARQE